MAEERMKIDRMKNELEIDMAIRNLILTRQQMICIPFDQGLTGAAFTKAKTIYYNDYTGASSFFLPESDNLKSYKNITNFILTPIVGFDGRPNGVI